MLLLAAAVLFGHALVEWDSTMSVAFGEQYRVMIAEERKFQCMEEAIARSVPRSALVAVDPALTDNLWTQRLVEMAYPRARIAPSPEEAEYLLSVEDAPAGTACAGVRVTARRSG